LEVAVREYQRRNGLESDGRVGPNTLAMLNVSVSTRVDQIIANMERWRWMPCDFEQRYVLVNVPDAMLEVVADAEVELTSRVIVGAQRTPTPLFRAEIIGVTVNPPWNVPASIARNEMLPRLQSDARYLAERNMVLVNGTADDPHCISIDWKAISPDMFPFQIRQDPSADNALGVLKLELPNRFSVYLHDTPARTLFALPERFLSHGCVRVQNIHPLASYLLKFNSTHGPDKLDEELASPDTVFLPLDDPMPVYVLYWTAMTNGDGLFGFRRDVYLRDERLIAELKSRVSPQLAMADDLGCPLPS
jgi:murein L,D-transpeptidase YcbB/YkuD